MKMKTQPVVTTPSTAQHLENACVKGTAGPSKISINMFTHLTWVPDKANIFNNTDIIMGTLTRLINKNIEPSDKPLTNMGGVLKHIVTVTTRPFKPLKVPKLGVTQLFDMVPVMCMAAPLQPMGKGMARSMVPTNVEHLKPPSEPIPIRHRVAIGCLSGMGAITIVHPLDVVKIRMQLYPSTRTTIQMLRRIVDCEGTRVLYAGYTAALLRQATYTSTRLAVYLTAIERYQKSHGGMKPPLSTRLKIATAAGLVGAFVGTPSEVALIHMTVEGRQRRSACSPNCSLACKKVRKTGNAITMLYRLGCSQGVRMLWRGATPTLIRSWFVSTAVVGSYGEVQSFFRKFNIKEGFQLHAYTAIVSSYITAVLSSPIDVIKTKYQRRSTEATMPEIIKTLIKDKGLWYLYKGFTPYYIRLAFHTIVTYYFMDCLAELYIATRRGLD